MCVHVRVCVLGWLALSLASAVPGPYDQIAEWMASAPQLRNHSPNKITNTLRWLATVQTAVKTMDGAAHELTAAMSDHSSLEERFRAFVRSDNRKTTEARKILNYVTAVEKGMQATELLQCAMCSKKKTRETYAAAAGYEILWREVVKGKLTVEVTALQRVEDKALYIIMVDRLNISSLLTLMDVPAVHIKLSSHGLVQETLALHPVILSTATKVLSRIGQHLTPQSHDIPPNATDFSQASNFTSDHVDEAFDLSSNSTFEIPKASPPIINMVGYSGGGAVASLVSMMLDGALNSTTATAQKYVGINAGRVRCVCMGTPPCISRALAPQYVITLVNGDDVIARAEPKALEKLKERVRKGSNLFGAIARDVVGVTAKGLKQYSTGHHDFETLKPVGRVYFMKKRRRKQGASITRVLQGKLREDLLWQLHEIVASDGMQRHHSLEEYIKTLSRV